MRILGISGSLRRDSHNTRLLLAAGALLPADAELDVFGGLAEIPPFSEDAEHAPAESVLDLRRAIDDADAVLIATPEYNGSLPGQLKNALDWISRPVGTSPLRGKPVAVVGASTGSFGAVWAQAEARKVLGMIGARVLERELPVAHAHETLAADGLRDDGVRDALAALLADLHAHSQPHALAA